MDETARQSSGWFPNPEQPGSLRYWDGERWTNHLAPAAPAPAKDTSTWTIARGVALGLLAVIALLVVISRVAASDDGLECAQENVERAQQGLPALVCD